VLGGLSRRTRKRPAEEGKPALRVGLPRALLTYRYYVLWKSFVAGLGCEVVESPWTNRQILDQGVRLTVDDICIPVKVYIGHLLYLQGKGVDAILAPRVYAVEESAKPRYTCPKFMGLPDMARAVVGEPPPLLDVDVNVRERPLAESFVEIGKRLGFDRKASVAAFERAAAAQALFEGSLANGLKEAAAASLSDAGPSPEKDRRGAPAGSSVIHRPEAAGASSEEEDLLVAVVGHPYLIFDDYLSFNLQRRLAALGARTLTQFAVSADVIETEMAKHRELSWSYERELLGAVGHFVRRDDIDGVVVLTSFACGTFAVISELIDREVRPGADKPLLYLMVDELTGEAGIQTRLESFCDMVRERKAPPAAWPPAASPPAGSADPLDAPSAPPAGPREAPSASADEAP
jgi:predicted nucleotide-binding protein (sugar kinase/HSP70/actin superfamily)